MANVVVTKMVSSFNDLSRSDFVRGLLVAVGTSVVGFVGETSTNGWTIPHTPAQWQSIAQAAFAGGVGYLMLKFKSGPKQIPASVVTNEPSPPLTEGEVGFVVKTEPSQTDDGTINYVAEINACQTIEELNELHPQIPPEFEPIWQQRFVQISNGNGGTPK